MPPGTRKSICVFCGSRDGDDPAFRSAASELGHALARGNYRLVYGAGDVGLMGAVARSAMKAGGDTFGVIPEHLMRREIGKRDLGALVVTETMHERKKVMFMNADAIVTLPGGIGSLDELFEILTWRQLGLHEKPIYLLNTKGYWTPLITLLMSIVESGFAEVSILEFFETYGTVPELMAALSADL